MDEAKKLVRYITKGIQEKKGHGIVVADLSKIDGTICRYFVICEGNSPMQVEAITDSIEETVREKLGEKPTRVVGLENAVWVAMDYVDVPDMRTYYDLETLWQDAKLTTIPDID